MKLKTSFFDAAVFKKNLTRFAPAWGLYTLCLLLGLMLMAESGLEYWLAHNFGECIQIMPIINCGYALVVAQLLFGDLFNTRMCNALHALPIRRETWFGTNVLSGLAFSFGPSLVMTLVALPLMAASDVLQAWKLPLLWLLGVNLQYLFFFAVAVLCVFCAGSRFAQVLLYGIVNLGANVVYWLADTIYVPMLFGFRTQYDAFLPFFPLGSMMDQPYAIVEKVNAARGFTLTERWDYLWLCAGLAAAMLALALWLYRRRKLETAGDFIAVKPLEPVFLVLYSLVAATFLQMFDSLFLRNRGYFFLGFGLVIGFFTGKMLLERRVNVFRRKNWVALAILAACVGASLVLTKLDPLGITRWVPRAESVAKVELSLGYNYGYGNDSVVLEDPEDIENTLFVHRAALEDRIGENDRFAELVEDTVIGEAMYYYHSPIYITLRYQLKNGTTATRYYRIWAHQEEGRLVKKWFSSLDCVTGTDDLVGELAGGYPYLMLDGFVIPPEYLEGEAARELLEAVEKDCAEGNLAQSWSFHPGEYIYESENYSISCLYLELILGDHHTGFEVYGDSRNTLEWLEENGVLDYVWERNYGEKYK